MSEFPSIPGYRILSLLGSGSFADVFLAEDESISRQVAIKLLRERTPKASQLDRFRRERETLARLNHPHVLRVHAAGSTRGRPYVVTELLKGQTLDDLKGSEDRERLLDLVEQAARGVAALHRVGLVHRDIKPDNLLLDEAGQIKVADLGLVGGEDLRSLTTDGALLGTPAYMAPEMCKGEGTRDPAGDVYSLGATLYEILTGSLPHPAATVPALLLMRLSTPDPDPTLLAPDLHPRLAAVCMRAMAGAPEDRYPDAGAFATALEAARLGSERPSERSLFPLMVVLVGLIGLVTAVGYRSEEPGGVASAPARTPRPSASALPSLAPAADTSPTPTLSLDELRAELLRGGAEPRARALKWIAANPGRLEAASRLRDAARAGFLLAPPTRDLSLELRNLRHHPQTLPLSEGILLYELCPDDYCNRQHTNPSRLRLLQLEGEPRRLDWSGQHVTARDEGGRFWAASDEAGRHYLYQRFGLEFDMVFELPGRCTALVSRGDSVVCGLVDGRILRPRLRPDQPTWEQRPHGGRVVGLGWTEERLVSLAFDPRPFSVLSPETGEARQPDFQLPTLGAVRWAQRLEQPEEYLLCVDGLNVVHGIRPDGTNLRYSGRKRLNPRRPNGQPMPWSPDGTTPRDAVALGGLLISVGSQRFETQRDSELRVFDRRSGAELVAERDSSFDCTSVALQRSPAALILSGGVGRSANARIKIWVLPAGFGLE